jgi:hypothetical protein
MSYVICHMPYTLCHMYLTPSIYTIYTTIVYVVYVTPSIPSIPSIARFHRAQRFATADDVVGFMRDYNRYVYTLYNNRHSYTE